MTTAMTLLEPLPMYAPAIRRWLSFCILLVVLMVGIGGVTRLTESGLSIVEWKLVAGTLPPMNAQAWQQEFKDYQTSPQFKKVNKGFTVGDFKQIFWLEYLHRLLGRIIGMVVLGGTFYFGLRKRFTKPLFIRMFAISALVGAQGTVGWVMVASGLHNEPRVEPIKLGLHLLLAFSLFAALLWTRWQVMATERPFTGKRIAHALRVLMLVLLVQIFFGALVAGLRAGLTYNSYPLMDGQFWPEGLHLLTPWWKNHLESALTVQFQHRMMALLVFFGVLSIVAYGWKKEHLRPLLAGLLAAVFLQFALGVATLLSAVNLSLASAHQLIALFLFSLLLRLMYLAPLDIHQRH